MVAQDDVDMETLQAQIGMSMSFAHDLVTSWIKPTHLARLRFTGVNTTQILDEELHRPPRLGVGAPIPTAPQLARETSKLRHRLGKNGIKAEGVESQPQDSSKSDNEEHKGRPTKRKMKTDPFSHGGSKKKKTEPKANSFSPVESAPKHSAPLLKNSALGKLAKHSQGYPSYPSKQASNRSLPDSSSGKEKQRMEPGDQRCHTTEEQRSVTLISLPERLPVQTTFSPSLTVSTAPSRLEPSRETSVPAPGQPTTPECNRAQTNFKSMPDKANPLSIPLLNLDGPPELIDKAGNASKLNSPKKKRKRRKKKKNRMITGSGDN